MRSYLDYQKSVVDSQNMDRSVFDGEKNVNKFCKHLYDSGYVAPQNNYRVIQDSDPVKAGAMTKARERYEREIKAMAVMHNEHLQQHEARVESDDKDAAREKYFVDQMKVELKKDLDDQMKFNEARRYEDWKATMKVSPEAARGVIIDQKE